MEHTINKEVKLLEALERAGIDLNKFEYHSKSTPRLRRQLIRLPNDTTMPREPTEEKVMEKLNEKINQGIYINDG